MVKRVLAIVLAALVAGPLAAGAESPARPAGQVVLTVAGQVTKPNRGAFDPFDDAFFKYHERHFAKAAVFDLAALEALGRHRVEIAYVKWPRALRFEGPWLRDVLAAAGATGRDLTVLALDGYATEISAADLARYDWILATRLDGHYLDIGQRGPLWIVYPGTTLTQADEDRWPYAVFMIEAK